MNLRRVAASFEEGYDYPILWNREMRKIDCPGAMLPIPSETVRVKRAFLWAWYTLREELSDAIHPDGPR